MSDILKYLENMEDKINVLIQDLDRMKFEEKPSSLKSLQPSINMYDSVEELKKSKGNMVLDFLNNQTKKILEG